MHILKIKTFVCVILIVSLLVMVNQGNMKDVLSLAEYAKKHSGEFYIVNDEVLIEEENENEIFKLS